MLEKNYKKILLNLLALIFIFALDRISKLYIIKLAEINNSVDIYLSSYLNLNLIWNKGIAFGMLSFDVHTERAPFLVDVVALRNKLPVAFSASAAPFNLEQRNSIWHAFI